MVFNVLDGTLRTERVLDDSVLVPCVLRQYAFSDILRLSGKRKSGRSPKSGLLPDLVLLLSVSSFRNGVSCFLGLYRVEETWLLTTFLGIALIKC